MKTFPILLNPGASLVQLPGISGPNKLGFVPMAMTQGWGFSLRPLLDINGEYVNNGSNNSSYKFKWTNGVDAAGLQPNVPASLPVYANVINDDGSSRLIRVVDDRLYQFAKRFRQVDLYFPITPNLFQPYVAYQGTSGGNPIYGSSHLICVLLESEAEYYRMGNQVAQTAFSPLRLQTSGYSPNYVLCDTSDGRFAGKIGAPNVFNPINFYGFQDTTPGPTVPQNFEAFFVFPSYQRWRMRLSTIGGAAQNLEIWSCQVQAPRGGGGNPGGGTYGGNFVLNEVILSTDPSWNTLPDGSVAYCFERSCSFVSEWIWVVSTGGAQSVQVDDMEICFIQ